MARITWRGGGGSGNGWAPSARNASSRRTARSVTAANVLATPTSAKLATLAALVGSGALRVPIQAAYTLDQLGEAIAAFQAGTRGKIAVRIR